MENVVIYWKTYGTYGDLWEIHSGKHTRNWWESHHFQEQTVSLPEGICWWTRIFSSWGISHIHTYPISPSHHWWLNPSHNTWYMGHCHPTVGIRCNPLIIWHDLARLIWKRQSNFILSWLYISIISLWIMHEIPIYWRVNPTLMVPTRIPNFHGLSSWSIFKTVISGGLRRLHSHFQQQWRQVALAYLQRPSAATLAKRLQSRLRQQSMSRRCLRKKLRRGHTGKPWEKPSIV